MTVSQMISLLKYFEKHYGEDIQVVLASDTEGNSFSTTDFTNCACTVREKEDEITDKAINDFVLKNGEIEPEKTKNVNAYVEKELNKLKVIGVCLFPYTEGFRTAENAVKCEEDF